MSVKKIKKTTAPKKLRITSKLEINSKIKAKKKEERKKFEFFEHTADVKFRAYGKDFSQALSNVGKATIDVMTDVSKIKKKHIQKINVESKTKESLVYDFVQKLIFVIDTEGFLTGEVSKIKIDRKEQKYFLFAELKGDNAKNYDVHTCIKSATYNDMEITEHKNSCTIQMVLDI